MGPDEVGQLARILHLSITPVALISGVGLLLLSMTGRLGRVVDRSRELGRSGAVVGGDDERRLEGRILYQRARLLQAAIAAISLNIFLAILMIAALFAMHLLDATLGWLILALFGACLACLVVSIACFLGDVILSIRGLRLSLGRWV